jgi:hypothetical protein
MTISRSQPPPKTSSPSRRRKIIRSFVSVALFAVTTAIVPHLWCGRDAARWYRGDADVQEGLARGVATWVDQDLGTDQYHTGSSQFNGEWLLMTYQLAGLGFGQTALTHPESRARNLPMLRKCCARVLKSDAASFDAAAWSEDPVKTLTGKNGHAGYLGYSNVVLSYDRWIDPAAPDGAVNDRFTAALVRRMTASSTHLIETYPGEIYPADNCVAAASIALAGRATGRDYSPLLKAFCTSLHTRYLDPKSGMLYQSVSSETGVPEGAPRASGTLFAAYFLSFVDPKLSADLFAAIRRNQVSHAAGFAAIREYPDGYSGPMGDVDSGPVIFGLSTSGTAFALASARMHGDEALFRELESTLTLVAAPTSTREGNKFLLGGPIGDALLFALLTAQPAPKEVS